MTISPLQHAKDTFNAFRVESVWLRSIFDTSYALFSSGSEIDALLKRTAPQFFADLNQMIVEYWILAVSRITDPAKTGKRENLTAALLLNQLDSLGLCTTEIHTAANRLQSYRALLNDARNRAVSHADKETFLNPALLGDHQESQVTDFLERLQEFNDLVGMALGEGPLDFRSTYGPGDVYDLLRALRSAT
jgi:hypothetical protein